MARPNSTDEVTELLYTGPRLWLPVTVIWNDPSITRPLLLTEKLKDTGTVDRSTRVKAERKHKIWRGALSPMNLILDLSKQWGEAGQEHSLSPAGKDDVLIMCLFPWPHKESKDSCLSQEWEAKNFHFTGPQEEKQFSLLTRAGS